MFHKHNYTNTVSYYSSNSKANTTQAPTLNRIRQKPTIQGPSRRIPLIQTLLPRAYWWDDGDFVAFENLFVNIGSVRFINIDIVEVHRNSTA